MGVVSVNQLNEELERALERVARGETVEIAEGDRIIAELSPRSVADPMARLRAIADADAILRRGLALGGQGLSREDRYGDAAL